MTNAMVRTDSEDSALVSEAQAGNADAFALLVERHFGMAYSIALSRLRDPHAAEDLAQEILLRAFLHLHKLSDVTCFPSWLCRIARNLAQDWIRSGRRRSALVPLVPLDEVTDFVADASAEGVRESMEKKDEKNLVQAALYDLPEDQREIIFLRYIEGLNNKEIAERLEMHPSTVGRQLARALKKMKRIVEPVLEGEARMMRPSRKASLRARALVLAVAGLSVGEKAALAAYGGGTAWMAASSASGGGIIKTIAAAVAAKGGLMVTVQGITAFVAAVLIAVGASVVIRGGDLSPTASSSRVAQLAVQGMGVAAAKGSDIAAARVASNQTTMDEPDATLEESVEDTVAAPQVSFSAGEQVHPTIRTVPLGDVHLDYDALISAGTHLYDASTWYSVRTGINMESDKADAMWTQTHEYQWRWVERDGDNVVFCVKSRHRKQPESMFRFSLYEFQTTPSLNLLSLTEHIRTYARGYVKTTDTQTEPETSVETRRYLKAGEILYLEGGPPSKKYSAPEGLLTIEFLYQIAPALPHDSGTTYQVAYWRPALHSYGPDDESEVIRCLPETPVVVSGRQVRCRGFSLGNCEVWLNLEGVVEMSVIQEADPGKFSSMVLVK